jgi:AcrR family transcriptional regulator
VLTEPEHPLTARSDLREALLDAAQRLIRERGAAGVTTREIAREAGCSEGALYVHFRDKAGLMTAVCQRWLPDLATTVGSLIERVGADTVQANLESIATAAVRSFHGLVPSMLAIGGDPDLLRHHRAAMKAAGLGPQRGIDAIGAYLAAEQRLGRVRPDIDPAIAASVLLGACWQRATIRSYFDEDSVPVDDAAFAAGVAAVLSRGLQSGGTA